MNLVIRTLLTFWLFIPVVQAVEILHWERMPLTIPLVVGQERVVFVDGNVRVGVPASLGEQLRVQSAGGAIYLRANEAIVPTRIQLQDVENGGLILLDITARAADPEQPPLEAVRIIGSPSEDKHSGNRLAPAPESEPPQPRETPVAVVLTRYAAQNLYAPLRTVEPVSGVTRVSLPHSLPLHTLLPALPVQAQVLAAWRLEDQWLTAVKLTSTATQRLDLDPRLLQGDFVAATFQHTTLGPAGEPADTTVVYLVTRNHGLDESLLPAISPVNAALNLPAVSTRSGGSDEK